MSRIPSHKRLWVLCGLVFVTLLACSLFSSGAWAQAKSQATPATKPLPLPETIPNPQTMLRQFMADSFSCIGPAKLESVSPQSLAFPNQAGEKGLQIALAGKAVSVMDEAGNPVSFSLVRAGTRVTACYRADKVVVIVMAQQGRKVGNARY